MVELCCVGHITADKVINAGGITHMAGGTSWYFSNALCKLDLNYLLVTALGEPEIHYATDLAEKGIAMKLLPSAHTVIFENSYAENQDHRTQRVLAKSDPFTIDDLRDVEAEIFHLGPLLADDISAELIAYLASKAKVSLDAQGYLRMVENEHVFAVDWPEKKEALKHVSILKVDEAEMQVLTGYSDVKKGAIQLAEWGVKEVVITNGSMGSVIYSDHIFYQIEAYPPKILVDATGCGDTYMAGYLYQRIKGIGIEEAGQFAAAMASLKMEDKGPFNGTLDEMYERMKRQ